MPLIDDRNTIEVESRDEIVDVPGEMIGFTIQGGPIIKFPDSVPENLPDYAQVLGYCEDNKPIVIVRRDAVEFISDVQTQRPESSDQSCRKGSQ